MCSSFGNKGTFLMLERGLKRVKYPLGEATSAHPLDHLHKQVDGGNRKCMFTCHSLMKQETSNQR